MISIADSQVLRWIDELNHITDADTRAKSIKREIRQIRKEPNSIQNKKRIQDLYAELDRVQFKPDYMSLIIDKNSDYHRACKGFSINGIRYKRLLGTNGGIKSSTIVFVSEAVHEEISRRIENGRDASKPLVTAKLEAYKALTCSASAPVSMPNGILVVNDCETRFLSNVIYISDENEGEPVVEPRTNQEIVLDASDGCGMMLPSLAERWSEELGLDYVMSGCNTRGSWEKGMLFTFDFIDFAEKVAGSYMVRDAWGNEVDIREVEVVFTTSMVKLWDSYESCDHYLSCSLENGYTFGITKTCPKELEDERTTNYQYLQSYEFSDEDIEELIAPTVQEIKDVLGGDWAKTVLFLKGSGLNERNVEKLEDDYIKAIMIDHRMVNDPFVRGKVYSLIKNRINEAKTGVVKVRGNFSIVSGDLYALCQSMFGLEVTGLLKKGEIFNAYWRDVGAKDVACFRSPMSVHNNIRLLHPADNDEVNYWFRYMNTCTVFNAWGDEMMALNGMDFDGDMVMLTDNPVLVRRLRPLPALMCMQRKAQKRVATEEDFVRSNIESFGNDIGKTTNWATSMYEVQSHFKPGSREYEELTYRIACSQHYQQNAIDKAKGIICKPMPRSWHDWHAVNRMEDEAERAFYKTIVAEKKPYFMRYIYPSLMKEYRKYIKVTENSCRQEFRIGVSDLMAIPYCDLTDRQKEWLSYYDRFMPVGAGNCVVNRICRRFEQEFDGCVGRMNAKADFDYSILKSGCEYPLNRYYEIRKLYLKYNNFLQAYSTRAKQERLAPSEEVALLAYANEEYLKQCSIVCPNQQMLCEIVLDLCYRQERTKKFAWGMCGHAIVGNLLEAHDYTMSNPVFDKDGEIRYCGRNYIVKSKKVEVKE